MLRALRAMRVLEALDSGALTRGDLDKLGYRQAGAWVGLAQVYFGPARPRTLQAAARVAASEQSLDALLVIEKHTGTLLRGAAVTDWELRVELCGLRGTVDEIDRAAAAVVRAYNRGVEGSGEQARARRALKGGKNTDGLGLRTCTLTLPERQMADMMTRLRVTAEDLRAHDPRLSHEQAMADAMVGHVLGGVAGAAAPVPVPHVVMALPDYVKVLRHEGDETIFALTDGTTITGAELVAREMATHGLVGIYDPVEGGVNLYREQRFANWKQRMLLAAETILCPTPRCTTSALDSQVHHLVPWKEGGETNKANLSIACRVHNARNDDDPDRPRNGRLVRVPGEVAWEPPDGGPPQINRHPIRQLSAMALITA